MKKFLLLFFYVSLVVAFLTSAKKISEIKTENALLWRITGNGLDSASYLFGTMHMGDKRILEHKDSLNTVMNEVQAVYGEIDLTDMVSQLAALTRMGMEIELKELISEEDYKLVKKKLEGTIVESMADRIKPVLTLGELSGQLIPTEEKVIIDMHIQTEAKKLGKKVGGIETISEQFDAIDEIPLNEQAEMLVEYCKNSKEQEELFWDMYMAYLNDDLNELQRIGAEEMEDEDESFERALLVERNRVMVERLEKKMKEETLLFAVGALHLPGYEGLIELLRNKGYSVEPIFTEKPKSEKE